MLGFGNYSYDWNETTHAPAVPLTYQAALFTARDASNGGKPEDAIDFDDQALNATYEYSDEAGQTHQVWMLDAASAYNQWRLAQSAGLGGEALWVLGSEDPAIWSFITREKFSPEAIPSEIEKVQFPYGVPQFVGDGEILKVVATPHIGHRTLDIDPASGRSPARPTVRQLSFDLYYPAQRLFETRPVTDFR